MTDPVKKERPILFNPEMVRAVLDGRKTQTRRTTRLDFINKAPGAWTFLGFDHGGLSNLKKEAKGSAGVALFRHSSYEETGLTKRCKCPYGVPGDRLWVRETHFVYGEWVETGEETLAGTPRLKFIRHTGYPVYFMERAPEVVRPNNYHKPGWYKRPSIFLERKDARILLEITDVRGQRVRDITPADAVAEGIPRVLPGDPIYEGDFDFASIEVARFKKLWDSINAGRGDGWDVNPWGWALTLKLLEVK